MSYKKKNLLNLIQKIKFILFNDINFIETEYLYLQHKTEEIKQFYKISENVGVGF